MARKKKQNKLFQGWVVLTSVWYSCSWGMSLKIVLKIGVIFRRSIHLKTWSKVFCKNFYFYRDSPLWRKFNRIPSDYAPLLKLFGRASLVVTVTILIERKFTAWLFWNRKQTRFGLSKEERKIQLSFDKKSGKKYIRMSSLSYLSLNLLSSRQCWHSTRKQDLLFMFWQKIRIFFF